MKRLGFSNFIDYLRRVWNSSTKQLSMVFFVGRGKAHTFRIPLVLVYGMLAVLAATTVWSVVSTGFLIFMSNQNSWLESQLDLTRGIVLKYQAQYERLFERSYPQLAQKNADAALETAENTIARQDAAKQFDERLKADLEAGSSMIKGLEAPTDAEAPEWSEATASNSSEAPTEAAHLPPRDTTIPAEIQAVEKEKEKEKELPPSALAEIKPVTPQLVPPPSIDQSPANEVDPAKSELLRQADLAIRDLRIVHADGGVDVMFNLQNSGRLRKAQGYLAVIGKFIAADGQQTYRVVPEMPGFDQLTGQVADFRRGESFSAARFRPARFRLVKPAGLSGKFVSVRIVLTDREGKVADETTKEVKNSDLAVSQPPGDDGG